MGNKQQKNSLFNTYQPRNIFSLYGPKTSSHSSSPTSSMQASSQMNDTIITQPDDIKKGIPIKRRVRQKCYDDYELHNNPDSYYKAIKFVTEYLSIETTLEINTTIMNEQMLQEEIKQLYENDKGNELVHEDNIDDSIQKEGQEESLLQDTQEYLDLLSKQQSLDEQQHIENTSVIQIKPLKKRNKNGSLKGNIENIVVQEEIGKIRPTAYFGETQKIQEDQDNEDENDKIDIPNLAKQDTFGGNQELGGIQITNQQSFENPNFAATSPQPTRQTAFFGDGDRQSQLRGYYKQLATRQNPHFVDNYQQNIISLQEEQEEDNEESKDYNENDNYQINQNNDYMNSIQEQPEYPEEYMNIIDINDYIRQKEKNQIQQNNNKVIENSMSLQEQDNDDLDEPIHIKIDLSASIKKKKTRVQSGIDKNIIPSPNKIIPSKQQNNKNNNIPSISPKNSKSPVKNIWKPTSPQLVVNKSPIKVQINQKPSNSTSKSPVRIDTANKERKKSSSFLIVNKKDRTREKNKSSDLINYEYNLDQQIDKLTNDIEVLDLIKNDIANVQNKIIKDMSPSYRKQNNQLDHK